MLLQFKLHFFRIMYTIIDAITLSRTRVCDLLRVEHENRTPISYRVHIIRYIYLTK